MYRRWIAVLAALPPLLTLAACGGPPATGGNAKSEDKSLTAPTGGAGTTSVADDGKLQAVVEEKLKAEPSLKDAKIEVKAARGQVTLTGSVRQPEQKDKAEEIVLDAIQGVSNGGVLNEVQIAE